MDLTAHSKISVLSTPKQSTNLVLGDRIPAILKVTQIISTKEEYGIAISKSKPELRVAIDGALTAMMNDGTYATIYKKWFGTEPPYAVPIQ